MQVPTMKNGFPNVHGSDTICPFCGDVCFETVGSDTSCASDSVHVSIGFHCTSGCCWELHLVSEGGELHPHCVLKDIHEEIRHQALNGSSANG